MVSNNILDILKSENDKEFIKRVYSEGIDKYKSRLKAIDFQGKKKVLDAGCGFGQWTFALAELNTQVDAFDFSLERVDVCKALQKENYLYSNINFQKGNIQNINAKDNTFDIIFCYSVIFFSKFEDTLHELFRVLKPNGKLYVTSNDIGWYLYNLENEHNSTSDFSNQEMAKKCFVDSVKYFSTKNYEEDMKLIMPIEYTLECIKRIGFKNIIWDGDGMINLTNEANVRSFYNKYYKNEVNVYEIIAEK